MNKEKKLLKALFKKALGYESAEEVLEYKTGEDGGEELIKKKVTIKQVPPDTAALKAYLAMQEGGKNPEDMTDEELLAERARLFAELETMGGNTSDISNKTIKEDE